MPDLAAQLAQRRLDWRVAAPRSVHAVDVDRPGSNASSPAIARRIVVLPEPDGPMQRDQLAALRHRTSTPRERRAAAAPQMDVLRRRSTRRHGVDAFQRRSSRARQRGERQRHRQVERRAERAGNHPAADIGRRKSASAWSARSRSAPTRATSPSAAPRSRWSSARARGETPAARARASAPDVR